MYIYFFKNIHNEIIYIGKTSNIASRLSCHFRYSHLPKDCYIELSTIEYFKVRNRIDQEVYEIYLINYYSPKYNHHFKYHEISELEFPYIDSKLYANVKMVGDLFRVDFLLFNTKRFYRYNYKEEGKS